MRRRILLLVLLLSFAVLAGAPQTIAQGSPVMLLQVFEVQPSPTAPLALNDSVVFHFNRRVACADAEAAFTVTPAISGELQCDQFSLRFTPTDEFERDTAYTFRANAPPLRSLDGASCSIPSQRPIPRPVICPCRKSFPARAAALYRWIRPSLWYLTDRSCRWLCIQPPTTGRSRSTSSRRRRDGASGSTARFIPLRRRRHCRAVNATAYGFRQTWRPLTARKCKRAIPGTLRRRALQ